MRVYEYGCMSMGIRVYYNARGVQNYNLGHKMYNDHN